MITTALAVVDYYISCRVRSNTISHFLFQSESSCVSVQQSSKLCPQILRTFGKYSRSLPTGCTAQRVRSPMGGAQLYRPEQLQASNGTFGEKLERGSIAKRHSFGKPLLLRTGDSLFGVERLWKGDFAKKCVYFNHGCGLASSVVEKLWEVSAGNVSFFSLDMEFKCQASHISKIT